MVSETEAFVKLNVSRPSSKRLLDEAARVDRFHVYAVVLIMFVRVLVQDFIVPVLMVLAEK
jgi:hypothetical protein